MVGMHTNAATVENSMEFPQKTKIELPFDPAIPLLGLYPRNPEILVQKNLCTPMFIAAQFTIASARNSLSAHQKMNVSRKLWYIYMTEYYAAERKKELLPFETAWTELESIMLSEISQAVKGKYHMISLISGT